jgi:hypothetical protein
VFVNNNRFRTVYHDRTGKKKKLTQRLGRRHQRIHRVTAPPTAKCLRERGRQEFVLKASPTEHAGAPPVFSDGIMYWRTQGNLLAIER